MKNKGFTLIELLAVIVILAVISLIATPIVLNVIEDAKKGAAIDSAYGYIDALESHIAFSQIDNEKYPYSYGLNDIVYVSNLNLSIKGTQPTSGRIKLINGKVETAHLCIDNYSLNYIDNEFVVQGNCGDTSVEVIIEDENIRLIFKDVDEYCLTTEETSDNCTWNEVVSNEINIPRNGRNSSMLLAISIIRKLSETRSIEVNYSEGEYNIFLKKEEEILKHNQKLIIEKPANDSILGKVGSKNYENDSIVNISANDMTYSAHIYTFNGDQVWTENMTFGDENDVATATSYANNMVIVKVNGDLTIESGVTIAPYYNTYGGPKGFLIYVTGTLTNNGTIDQKHGAKAIGENVYLWKNTNDEYEVIPAIGGAGGDKISPSEGTKTNGNVGKDGSTVATRALGGGGSGGQVYVAKGSATGAGSAATSYSGGTGGGGIADGNGGKKIAGAGSANGGAGGAAAYGQLIASGGSGNPGGKGRANGGNGTGGLLIIYATNMINNGTITVNGTTTGYIKNIIGGGSSGGGSVNIFYSESYQNTGSITNEGGVKGGDGNYGGAGGSGTTTIGRLLDGNFIKE